MSILEQAYQFNLGENFHCYRFLGAQPTAEEGRMGWRFTVWAPHARQVSVIGDFNAWQKEAARLEPVGETGCWTVFLPELPLWSCYKYAIQTASGTWLEKADPCAQHYELRPKTASRLYCEETPYLWHDADFMAQRPEPHEPQPLNIYECHLGSWRRFADGAPFSYPKLAEELGRYLRDMGYNALEIMPVTEYPLDDSWGYQVTGYFAPTSRYGTAADFKYFVDHMHGLGIKVILDWVPAHFPRDGHGLACFDGEPCYEHADSRKGEHKEWGTLVFDYAKKEVQSFLLSSALFWIEEFHIDGLRVDAVSSMLYLDYQRTEWLPNIYGGKEHLEAIEFLRRLNGLIRYHHPQVSVIAEESTAFPFVTKAVAEGGLGFTHKWNMGWMHDTLDYFSLDHYARTYHHHKMTFSMTYAFSEQYVLPFSHDEVVHGKRSLIGRMPGDIWRQCAGLRTCQLWQFTHPGAKLNFMGNEFGQFVEWRFREELEWFLLEHQQHRQLLAFSQALNHFYLEHPALWEDEHSWSGFRWLQADDAEHSVYAYLRNSREEREQLLVILNLTPAVLRDYVLPLPAAGCYRSLLNSDDEQWGGSQYLGTEAKLYEAEWFELQSSGEQTEAPEEDDVVEGKSGEELATTEGRWQLCLDLPPLAGLILKLEAKPERTDL